MAKKQNEAADSAEATSPKEKAVQFFNETPQYTMDEVIVTDDLTVFPGSAKGANAADNYCQGKGIGHHKYSRD